MKNISKILITILLSINILTPVAIAQEEEPTTTPQTPSLQESTFDVSKFLRMEFESEQPMAYFKDKNNEPLYSGVFMIINFAIKIMGSIGVILLIIAGGFFMFSQGNDQQLDKGKDILKYALIGIAMALLSYVIVITVQAFFNY